MQKRRFKSLKSILTIFVQIIFIVSLSKALMIKLSLEKLTICSDAIILGEVKEIQCQWSLDNSVILTMVTLQVIEILKGSINNNKILIQYPGGQVEDIGLKVSDMPSFHLNEKGLVFLTFIKDPQNEKNSPLSAISILPAFSIFGAAQGKFSIDSNGIAYRSGYSLISKDLDSEMSLSLEDLIMKIKNILKKKPKEREKIREKIKC